MTYTVDNALDDLQQGIKPWSEISQNCADSGITMETFKKAGKTEAITLINEYRKKKCPQEYKDNPQIHYEVPHFGSPNKFNK